MNTITWDIPRETLFALKGSTEDVGAMLRMASAVKLYEMGKLSSGVAARPLAALGMLREGELPAPSRATWKPGGRNCAAPGGQFLVAHWRN